MLNVRGANKDRRSDRTSGEIIRVEISLRLQMRVALAMSLILLNTKNPTDSATYRDHNHH